MLLETEEFRWQLIGECLGGGEQAGNMYTCLQVDWCKPRLPHFVSVDPKKNLSCEPTVYGSQIKTVQTELGMN